MYDIYAFANEDVYSMDKLIEYYPVSEFYYFSYMDYKFHPVDELFAYD